jgi:hypothetical protein
MSKGKSLEDRKRELLEQAQSARKQEDWQAPPAPQPEVKVEDVRPLTEDAIRNTPLDDTSLSEVLTFRVTPLMLAWYKDRTEKEGITMSAKLDELMQEAYGKPPAGWEPPEHLRQKKKGRRR